MMYRFRDYLNMSNKVLSMIYIHYSILKELKGSGMPLHIDSHLNSIQMNILYSLLVFDYMIHMENRNFDKFHLQDISFGYN